MSKSSLSKLKTNTLLSGTAIYLFSNILNAAIPFALLPILTRYLNPAEYGEIAMFQTLLAGLAAVTGFSVAGACNRKYYDNNLSQQDMRAFIASSLQILLASSGMVFLIMLVFHTHFEAWLGLDKKWILWAVIVSACSIVIQIRLGQWQVRKEAKKYGALQISQSLFNMLLSLLLVVALMQGAAGRIQAQVYAAILFAIIALILLKKDRLLGFFNWRPEYIKEALKFGIPLIPHIGGIFLLTSIDRLVINTELGIADAGIYMVAVQLAGSAALIFDALNKAYVPWLYERLKRDRAEEKKQIVRFTYLWFLLILLGSALAFLIGPWLVVFIAGQEYSKAGEVIGWLFLGQALGGMYLMVTNYIFYSKRTGLLSLATVFSGLLNILLLVVLIRLLGLEGASIAFSVAMAVRFLLTWWVAQKVHPMPWFSFRELC